MSQQIRTQMTKSKRHRLLKKEKSEGQPKPLPPKHIPVTDPVIIPPTATRQSLAQPPKDQRLTSLLAQRRTEGQEEGSNRNAPPLRYHLTNLEHLMSPKVRQLFQLTNASSSEVSTAQKLRAMELFEMRPGDTGSSAVQIMALTSRIQQVQKHLKVHRKDHSGKRGLDALYVRRRKLLDYLERKDFDTYRTVVKSLGLVN